MRLRSSLGAFLILCLLAVFGVDRASAGQVTFDRWSVALEAASMTWGGNPPCGTPTFAHHEKTLPTENTDMFVYADTSKPETLPYVECVIHVSEHAESLNPGDACAEVVHEVGHLFGLDHSPDRNSVMYRKGVDYATPGAWACEKLMKATVYATKCGKKQSWGAICRPVYRWSLR
jgi:hypothetical protein